MKNRYSAYNASSSFQLGCQEKSGSVANRSSEEEKIFCPSVMSPLDRIVKTKPIWFCQDVSRDEVIQMLHNKKTGVRYMTEYSNMLLKKVHPSYQ